jgi:hypothetical protein
MGGRGTTMLDVASTGRLYCREVRPNLGWGANLGKIALENGANLVKVTTGLRRATFDCRPD